MTTTHNGRRTVFLGALMLAWATTAAPLPTAASPLPGGGGAGTAVGAGRVGIRVALARVGAPTARGRAGARAALARSDAPAAGVRAGARAAAAPAGAAAAGSRAGVLPVRDAIMSQGPAPVAGASPRTPPPADLVIFVRPGCPRCAAAERYLAELRRRRPHLTVIVREVPRDRAALQELQRLSRAHGVRAPGVPTFVVGDQLVVGFEDATTTGRTLEGLLDREAATRAGARLPAATAAGAATPAAQGGRCGLEEAPGGPPQPCVAAPATARTPAAGADAGVVLPLIGRVAVQDVGLPLFTAAIGLLDGFNPCAMWVLLFLLSVLVSLRSRRKMLLIGGVFLLVSGLVYFAFMAAWLNVFLLIGLSRWIQVTLGLLAVTMGAINLKDFVAFGRGLSLKIPESAKPGIYRRMRQVVGAERLLPALAGVTVLAGLVNTVELLCTAGLPALYTQVLTLRGLPTWAYYAYLALYNLFYMLDDMVVLTIAVVTLSHTRLQQREARWLKAVAGTLMLALGLALLIRPELLAG